MPTEARRISKAPCHYTKKKKKKIRHNNNPTTEIENNYKDIF
jgi:hypothetical protein